MTNFILSKEHINIFITLPVIQAGLEMVQWFAAAVAVMAVEFVFCFLTAPKAVFETYYLAVPALPSNSSAAAQPLFSSKGT